MSTQKEVKFIAEVKSVEERLVKDVEEAIADGKAVLECVVDNGPAVASLLEEAGSVMMAIDPKIGIGLETASKIVSVASADAKEIQNC